jgi:hypothetical protein
MKIVFKINLVPVLHHDRKTMMGLVGRWTGLKFAPTENQGHP